MAQLPGGGKRAVKKDINCTAMRRLKQDYKMIMTDPVPYVEAAPLESNILEWHYVIRGPQDSPYKGGIYHGKLLFPAEYPFKPPSIYMITPNGRFKTNIRLCLSISDFHPDTWIPTWNVSTILTGLLSFMLESQATYGSIVTSNVEKAAFAKNSALFNLKDPIFCKVFPHVAEEIRNEIALQKSGEAKKAAEAGLNGNSIPNSIDGQTNGSKGSSGPKTWFWSFVINLALGLVLVGFYYIAKLIINQSDGSNER